MRTTEEEYLFHVEDAEQAVALNVHDTEDIVWLDLRDSRKRVAELESIISAAINHIENLMGSEAAALMSPCYCILTQKEQPKKST